MVTMVTYVEEQTWNGGDALSEIDVSLWGSNKNVVCFKGAVSKTLAFKNEYCSPNSELEPHTVY